MCLIFRVILIDCIGHSVDPFNLASQFWGIFLNYFVDYFFQFVSIFLEPILLSTGFFGFILLFFLSFSLVSHIFVFFYV